MKINQLKFKPTLIPTLFTVPAIIVLLGLGSWQVHRLNWKLDIIEEIESKVKSDPIELPQEITDIDDFQYRKVVVRGEFVHSKEVHLFVGAREFRGEPGYDLITPLKRADGGYVLIDRGWVPSDKKEQVNRQETLESGEVQVVGMIQKGEIPGTFTPENNMVDNLWFWISMVQMREFTGYQLGDYYVRALKLTESDKLPIAGEEKLEYRNDHLQYAITWYCLAIILLVIYVAYHLKNDNKG